MYSGRHYYREPGAGDLVLPMMVCAAGTSLWRNGAGFSRRNTGFWGLELVSSGAFHFTQDGIRHTCLPGDLFILRHGSTHEYHAAPGSVAGKRYLQLRGPLVGPLMSATGLRTIDRVRIPSVARAGITAQFRTALRALDSASGGGIREASNAAYAICATLSVMVNGAVVVDETITRLCEWIQHRLGGKVTAQECAEHAGMSLAHLNRRMNRACGCSVKAWITGQRMGLAASLLRETTRPVSGVAALAGYDDPLYFSARFRAFFGLSPSQYRTREQLRVEA